jgi:hypothetical protein
MILFKKIKVNLPVKLNAKLNFTSPPDTSTHKKTDKIRIEVVIFGEPPCIVLLNLMHVFIKFC